jgi:hypothetical protein
VELLKGYHDARRQFVEKTFARHTHRAQLARIRAKILLGGCAGHTRAASSLERYRPNQLSRKEAIISFKSGEKPDNLYGEDVWAVVVDEASRTREEAYWALRSTLTATGGPIRIIGNVKGRKNCFYAKSKGGLCSPLVANTLILRMRSVGKDAILQTVFTARNKCRRHGSIRNEMDVPDRLRATNSTITIDPTCQRPRPGPSCIER